MILYVALLLEESQVLNTKKIINIQMVEDNVITLNKSLLRKINPRTYGFTVPVKNIYDGTVTCGKRYDIKIFLCEKGGNK